MISNRTMRASLSSPGRLWLADKRPTAVGEAVGLRVAKPGLVRSAAVRD